MSMIIYNGLIEEKEIHDNVNWVDIYDLEFDQGY